MASLFKTPSIFINHFFLVIFAGSNFSACPFMCCVSLQDFYPQAFLFLVQQIWAILIVFMSLTVAFALDVWIPDIHHKPNPVFKLINSTHRTWLTPQCVYHSCHHLTKRSVVHFSQLYLLNISGVWCFFSNCWCYYPSADHNHRLINNNKILNNFASSPAQSIWLSLPDWFF